jgi:pimeloyl-ACP methyl ester carboxylesterase
VSELRRVTLSSGIELDTVDVGPRDAPALVFLHGFPESHLTWRHQIAHLSDRYRCIAPDQRGYGRSSKPEGIASYSPDHLVADIFQLAEALGVERFTVIGHDWGGVIAWGVAAFGQGFGRVTRAVILNAPHPNIFQRLLWLDPAQRRASQYTRMFRDPAHDALVRDYGLGALIFKAIDWERPMPAQEAEVRDAYLAQWRDPETALAMLAWYRASLMTTPALDEPYGLPADLRPMLPPLTIPTLVVWGMLDEALLPANLEGLEDLVEKLTVVRVPEAGHFVTWEAPDAVNAALDAFLSRRA